ncbi:unnamed protein product [Rotaria sp. Silwood2]|nr:unnamed protein product [Rotaria sp. Silwood2]
MGTETTGKVGTGLAITGEPETNNRTIVSGDITRTYVSNTVINNGQSTTVTNTNTLARQLEIAYGLPAGSLIITNIVIRGITTNAGSGRRRRALYRTKRDVSSCSQFGFARLLVEITMRVIYPKKCGVSQSCKTKFLQSTVAQINAYGGNIPLTIIFADGRSITLVLYPCTNTGGLSLFDITSLTTTTTPAPVCSLQWNTVGTTVAGAANGAAGVTLNRLSGPRDIFLGSSSTLNIADSNNNRVQKWTIGAAAGTTVAGQTGGAPGAGANQLRFPTGVVVDETSTVLVVDDINDRVQSWPLIAVQGTTIAGAGGNGAGNNQFNRPFGIARDANTKTLYISDSLNHRVMRYLAGAAAGTVVAGGNGGGNANNQLNFPAGIYFDAASNSLVIANRNSHNIIRWAIVPNTRTVIAGSAAGVAGNTAILLSSPDGVTLDSAGNIYVADTGNNRIQLFKVGQTNAITIAGVPGLPNANPSSLRGPSAVRLDSQGNLYVADRNNNRIQMFMCIQS